MDLIKIDPINEIKHANFEVETFNDLSDSDIKISLIDPTYTQQQISSEAMPSPIGGIAVNAELLLKLKNPIQIFKYPENFIKSIEIEGIPDIVGFSNYVWNFQLSLNLAKAIKKLKPETIIVMGGPNYPITSSEKELFLREFPEIDFYVAGEGEVAFTNLISILIKNNLNIESIMFDVPSIQFIDANNIAHISEPIERTKNLADLPSPYTTGKLDKFFDGKLQPTVQTTRGCPFGCTFCVEGEKYYSKVNRSDSEKIFEQLHYIGKKMEQIRNMGGRNDLWIVDSNFGMYSQDIETCKIVAECQKKYRWPEYIQCDTGKNNKARVLDAAKLVNGAIRLSGAVQSLDKDVLKNIKRSNISADVLMQTAAEAAEINADSRSDIILGLPGESLKTHFETLKTVSNAGFSHVNTFQLMMLPGTELNDPFTRKQYGIKTKFRVLPRCFGFYEVFNEKIISAEIEEICVTTDSLSFDDYVNSRKMHLLIHVYFNDGLFDTALKFLKNLNISVFEWIEIMYSKKMNGLVKEFFDLFEKDTRNELWDKKEDLLEYIQKPKIIEKYIAGDLGYNLLFVYKSIAMQKYISELRDFALDTLKEVLKNNYKDSNENIEFMSEALNFDLCRSSNMFKNLDNNPKHIFNFNIKHFQETKNVSDINLIKLLQPLEMKFILNQDQIDIINRSVNIYGLSDIGISRILTKVFVKKLLRTPIMASPVKSVK
jgi:radical SAM superfamily enzyme YgiQ (UPF0313 family)